MLDGDAVGGAGRKSPRVIAGEGTGPLRSPPGAAEGASPPPGPRPGPGRRRLRPRPPQHGRGAEPRDPPTLPRAPAASSAAAFLGLAFWFAVHYVHTHVRVNPLLVVLYPPLTLVFIALALPFIMFASFAGDFERSVNPLNPMHYAFIFRKCYGAMLANNMKVASKDL